jgi:hypothetical protein
MLLIVKGDMSGFSIGFILSVSSRGVSEVFTNEIDINMNHCYRYTRLYFEVKSVPNKNTRKKVSKLNLICFIIVQDSSIVVVSAPSPGPYLPRKRKGESNMYMR